MPADDPGELFDVCDPSGLPLGEVKPRALVHRDGDWHRSVHIWVVTAAAGFDGAHLLLQRRSLSKDSHPGKLDVSVAGHLRAGETHVAALREAEEELGLSLAAGDLVRLGLRRRIDQSSPPRVDREVQEIFFACTTQRLESLLPDPHEVLGVVEVNLAAATALFHGSLAVARGLELRPGGARPFAVDVRAEELLPAPDGYFARAADDITARRAGLARPEWALAPFS